MPRDDERPYGIDDLVAHEKGQMRFVLLIMVLAMIYFAGQRVIGPDTAGPDTGPDTAPETAPDPGAAPVRSGS